MSMAGSFARSLERPSTVARFALSIIRNELPKDYYQTYLKQLEAITKEDLLMVAQKYMTGSNCNIIVVGHEDVIGLLTQFDADGKIEKIDAFGNTKIERIASDITADELIEKYTSVIALGSTGKKLAKKLKKAKSLETVIEVTNAQLPKPGKLTEIWMNTGAEGTMFELMGMTYFKSYFTGEAGGSSNMQTGAEVMTAEEIAAKKKSQGLIPEMNYTANGMKYELLGIEDFEGKMCYALALNDGDNESINYYDKETMYKSWLLLLLLSQKKKHSQW